MTGLPQAFILRVRPPRVKRPSGTKTACDRFQPGTARNGVVYYVLAIDPPDVQGMSL